MRRRINTKPWRKPPWKRRSGRPGEWLSPSQSSADSLGAKPPWGVPIRVDYPGFASAPPPETAIDRSTAVLLSSAVEDALLGQPIWPKHTVVHITGEIFVAPTPYPLQVGETDGAPFILHMGIRKFRYDDLAASPSFEIDGDPGGPDEADSRWIWRKHLWVPPAFMTEEVATPAGSNPHRLGDTGNTVTFTRDPWGVFKVQHLSLNVRNKVRIEEDEGLLLVFSTSATPTQLGGGSVFEELDGGAGTCQVLPFLRSYVVADR